MPNWLLSRCRPNSTREFQLAARERFLDGVSLAREGRRTAAIYLWGYAGEMTRKAAYFRLIGFLPTQPITKAALHGAVGNAAGLGFAWVGNLHHLESWARLLVSTRAATPGMAYPIPAYGSEVLAEGRRIQLLWSETLRYHKNRAYPHELGRVRMAAEWLLLNGPDL